jgi:hypothetical protein
MQPSPPRPVPDPPESARPRRPAPGDPTAGGGVRVANLLTAFYDPMWRASAVDRSSGVAAGAAAGPAGFAPDPRLPRWQGWLTDLFSPATAAWQPVGTYAGHRLTLLNLARDPATNTTKTFPSLLIVARAVQHIRDTGEHIMIVSPTSGNKGIALRSAVARALALGLAGPEQLRVLTISPTSTAYKLRQDPLATDPGLRRLNPALVLATAQPEQVKALGRAFVEAHAERVEARRRIRLWYTLDLANYILADVTRAYFEHVADPAERSERPRVHVQAVSSAFGLLGYHLGRSLLESAGLGAVPARPRTLAVQHLATPDMVLHLRYGDCDRGRLPGYVRVFDGGVLSQAEDPHFPYLADSADELIDGTFYSARPLTCPMLSDVVHRHGGDGIVVSRAECLARYPSLRSLLTGAGFAAPQDPRQVREWSLAMALTGAFNAADRGLLAPDCDIVVHATGWYTAADYQPMTAPTVPVSSPADVEAAVLTG